MNEIKSIAFTRRDDEISAILLYPDFTGYELIYDELEDRIVEAYLVDATGTTTTHTTVSLNEIPVLITLKVKRFIKLNYGI